MSSPLAAVLHHWRRIALYALLAGLFALLYRYRVLPGPADALLDYFIYMACATSITPLPTPPVILYAATQAPVLLVAAVGAAGTVIAYLIEYALLGRLLAHERLGRMRRSRAFRRLAAWFDRVPFVALSVAAFLPLPVDGVRFMAIARNYDRRRYALAAFLGRLPRYALIAGLGASLRFLAPGAAAGEEPAAPGPAGAAAAPALADSPAADSSRAVAADAELLQLLLRLDTATARLTEVRGRFSQERRTGVFPEPERSSGQIWFRRPGDLVLHYREPDDQWLYVDEAGVWIYLVSEKQAQRHPFTTAAQRDAALAVLWQPSPVLRRLYGLERADPPGGEVGGTWLKLVPRDPDVAEAVVAAYLRIHAATGLSDCVLVEQENGERVRLEVEAVERDPKLDQRIFRFDPPPGVEVIRF